MTNHTTEESIHAATVAIQKGISIPMLKRALLGDGFTKEKIEVIVRWALRINFANEYAIK